MKLLIRISVALMLGVFCFGVMSGTALAAFDKNRIIDDPVFNSVNTMSAASIDAFLNANNSCISSNSGFRAIDPVGYSPSTGYQFGGHVTAGTVIAHAAQAYDLNPQVLLVTLQKEQSLVTTTPGSANCSTRTISKAMGYACTDSYQPNSYTGIDLYSRNGVVYTAVDLTCVESIQKAGFSQQMIRAAWLLKFTQQRSLGNIGWAIIRGSWDNSDDLQSCYSGPVTQGWRQVCPSGPTTFYDGYTTIDGQSVHPESGATVALYRYTPHFPGNQNFVTIWTSWFGGTIVNFDALAMPRWMRVKNNDVYKQDLATNQNTEGPFPQGTQLLMYTKITMNGVTYLRTAHDTGGNLFQGIPISNLEEIPYENMLSPRWMKLTGSIWKQVPRQGRSIDSPLAKNLSIYFTTKTVVNGTTYVRTAHDTRLGNDKGIPIDWLTDVSYEPLVIPRWMKTDKPLYKIDPLTGGSSGPQIPAGTQIKFDTKLTLANTTYLRDATDTAGSTSLGISLNDLSDNMFEKMVLPRAMKLNKNSNKYDVRGLAPVDSQLSLGQQITFKSKIFVNDQWYLRTAADSNADVPYAVPLADLSEL
jgi:hypothetical protein